MDSFYFWLSPWDVVFFCQFVKLVIHRSSLFHSWFQLTVDSLAPLRLTPRTKNRIRYSQLIGFYALATQPDNVGESIMYCVVRPPRLSVRPFVRSFVQADLVTTISHKRLEQSRWNLDGIFTSFYWSDSGGHWLKVKVIAGRQRGEGIHVDTEASKSIF